MNIDTQLKKCYSATSSYYPTVQRAYASFDGLGKYMLNSFKKKSNGYGGMEHYFFDLEEKFVPFIEEGYFNIVCNADDGIGAPTIYSTDKLRQALKGKTGTGIKHLLSDKSLAVMRWSNEYVSQISDWRAEYKRGDLSEWHKRRFFVSGMVNVTNGVISLPDIIEKKIKVYVKRAMYNAKAALKMNWELTDITLENKIVTQIQFNVVDEKAQRHYEFSLSMPDSCNEGGERGNYKCARDAALYYPEEFYAQLKKGMPPGMDMMLPAAILKGFGRLRNLLTPDETPEPVTETTTQPVVVEV